MPRRVARERIPVTEAKLAEVALGYLDRVAASRRMLAKKLESWVRQRGEPPDPELAAPLIESLLDRYERSRLLDDRRLAENAVGSLRARGVSSRAIQYRLQGRGLGGDLIASALDQERSADADAELGAARAFVRRRRLGPFRAEPERTEKRRKDLAALCRAGFDWDTARRALECDDVEAPE